jgi:uncharacterized protein YoxC
LTGNTDIEDSLSRLDKLTQEEARMASAELLKVTHRVDNKVTGIDDRVKNVEGKVQDVRGDVQGVGNKVQDVDDRMQGIGSEVRGVNDKLDDVNRSLSLNTSSSRVLRNVLQGTTSEIVFYDGFRPQIHQSTIILHLKLVTMVLPNGFFKAAYSINGNPPTPSYGYTENVRYS